MLKESTLHKQLTLQYNKGECWAHEPPQTDSTLWMLQTTLKLGKGSTKDKVNGGSCTAFLKLKQHSLLGHPDPPL